MAPAVYIDLSWQDWQRLDSGQFLAVSMPATICDATLDMEIGRQPPKSLEINLSLVLKKGFCVVPITLIM